MGSQPDPMRKVGSDRGKDRRRERLEKGVKGERERESGAAIFILDRDVGNGTGPVLHYIVCTLSIAVHADTSHLVHVGSSGRKLGLHRLMENATRRCRVVFPSRLVLPDSRW